MSECFHVKFSFTGFIVLQNKTFKWPTLFLNFCDYPPLKRAWPFIWILSTKGLFVQSLIDFGLLVLEKRIFKNFQCIFTLSLLSPLGEALFPSFEQTWIPFTKGWFVPSLVKIGPVVLEKKIFKWPHPIFTFLWLSPLWRGPGPLFEQTWIPFTQG